MNHKEIKHIAIVGGLEQSVVSAAQVFAGSGRDVTIKTTNTTQCTVIEDMSARLDRYIRDGLIDINRKEAILDRVTITIDAIEAFSEADMIFETVSEVMDTKRATFQEMEEHAPSDCIFASGTSAFSISDIAEAIENKSRVIGMHFWNPAAFIPMAEVIRTEQSNDKVVQIAIELLKSCGISPTECKKDMPGFQKWATDQVS